MVKSKMLTVMVEPEFHEQVIRKSEETGIPYSEVVRRALEAWLVTGEMPKSPPVGGRPPVGGAPKAERGKHKTKR